MHLCYNIWTLYAKHLPVSQVWHGCIMTNSLRIRAALNPSLHWEQVDLALWIQVLPSAKPKVVHLSHSGHVIQKPHIGLGPWPQVAQPVQPDPVCWEFSSQGTCSRKVCNYRHKCSICSGSNFLSACPRGRPKKFQCRFGGVSGEPQAGKGSQPSKPETA